MPPLSVDPGVGCSPLRVKCTNNLALFQWEKNIMCGRLKTSTAALIKKGTEVDLLVDPSRVDHQHLQK